MSIIQFSTAMFPLPLPAELLFLLDHGIVKVSFIAFPIHIPSNRFRPAAKYAAGFCQSPKVKRSSKYSGGKNGFGVIEDGI